MCYWRRLSKRSTLSSNETQPMRYLEDEWEMDDESPPATGTSPNSTSDIGNSRQNSKRSRRGRKMSDEKQQNLSDKMSLSQSLLVRPLEDPDANAYTMQQQEQSSPSSGQLDKSPTSGQLLCYRRVEVLAFLLATGSLLLMAMSVTVACCWQQTNKLKRLRRSTEVATSRGLCGGASSSTLSSFSSANSTSGPAYSVNQTNLNHHHSLVAASSGRARRLSDSTSSIRQPPLMPNHNRLKERLLIMSFLQ